MHTRDISVGGRTISIETGRMAKQADGAVRRPLGRHRRPRHRLRRPPTRAKGSTSCPLTVRLQGKHLRVGADPRRLLQARRQADREGSAHQPPDRSSDPPALPRHGWRNETQIIALVLSADARERHRRARDHRRLGGAGALDDSVAEDDRRRPRRPDRRQVRHQPDLRAAQAAASSISSSPAPTTAS